jgi:oxygen-dependent protoporphyrinogen oxidase
MPRFKELERAKRSISWGMWSAQRRRARNAPAGSGARWSLFVTLAGGMQELVETLGQRLPEGSVRLNARVRQLVRDESRGVWRIAVDGGESIEAAAVIVAAPAFSCGEMLRGVADGAANELAGIPYASTATVSLAYRSEDFSAPLDSFGFVVPAVERRKIMACTFSSIKYPGRAPAGGVLLRAFVGGTLQPELYKDDDSTMAKNVRDELTTLLGLTAQPLFTRIWRHPRSMPQYHVGHEARIKRIEAAIGNYPGLALAGSAYHGVGISDCVRTGEEAAAELVQQLAAARPLRGRDRSQTSD